MTTKGVCGISMAASFLVAVLCASVASADSAVLLPLADGNYAQWIPSAGTSHFALVDDATCNGLTDYNSTTVVGNRDSYQISSTTVPDGAKITKIEIKPCASRVSNGGTNPVMDVFYRFGGVDSAASGSYSLTGTTPVGLGTTTFSGLSLVKSSTTTLEIGAVLTSSTKGARLSQISAVFTYWPLLSPSGLSATATTSSAVGLSWTDNASSTESEFAIERSLDGSSWNALASTTQGITSYYDTGLTASTTYYYRVRAFNYAAYSGYSATASTTTTDYGSISLDASALNTVSNCTACNLSFAVGSSTISNGMIVLHVRSNWAITSATDNGSSMPQAGSRNNSGVYTTSFTFNPTTTANAIIVNQGTQDDISYGIESFNCATSFGEYQGAASGAGGSPTLTFGGLVTGEWVSLFGAAGTGGSWSGTPYTQRQTGTSRELGDSGQVISGSTIYTWNGANFNYGIGGVSIIPASGTCN